MAKDRYNFSFKRNWNWEDLEEYSTSEQARNNIAKLKDLISIDDASFLFRQLLDMDSPEEIRRLFDYQRLQKDWGGSFYGIIPEQVTEKDSIPVPTDFETLVESALFLAEIRSNNYDAITNTGYLLKFKNEPFKMPNVQIRPANMSLDLDISGIQELLKLFAKDSIIIDEAMEVASHPAFTEMIKHRQSLGYIPKPWVTEESLARFIQRAVSREPLDMIWKWLNPWNFFNFADIFLNLKAYKRLLDAIDVHKEDIVDRVLGRISLFAPKDVEFRDRFSFAVGWGIRGWATESTAGVNIEHFKDDFDLLIRTFTHETFHRLQLRVCSLDTSRKDKSPREFEDLVYFSFPDEKDRKFYEVITYIFLEGSATFIGGVNSTIQTEKQAVEGLKLLHRVYQTIYNENNLEKADELLNLGLKSNGPFYALGYYMTSRIVDKYGSVGLSHSLLEGSVEFFRRYFKIFRDTSPNNISESLRLGEEIEEKVNELSKIRRGKQEISPF